MKCQFGNIVRESDVCVICGERPAVTGEHIPPRALFLKQPSPFLVVPACRECNEGTKLDDDHLRQFLAACSWTPEGLAVWKEKVAIKFPDFPATQAGLRESIDSVTASVPSLGDVRVSVLLTKATRIDRVVHKMARGLHWFHTGEILALDVPMSTRFFNLIELKALFDDPDGVAALSACGAGVYRDPEVIRSFYYSAAIEPPNSVWNFFFYRQNAITVFVGPDVADGGTT